MAKLLEDWLRQQYPRAKQNTLRRMLDSGRVRVNGAVARKMKQALPPEARIEVEGRPAPIAPPPASLHPLRLIFEDADLLVVDKPAGLLTSTVPRELRPTALAIIRRYAKEHDPAARIGLIHRLDRDASGLLVFSKSDEAYRSLKQQFFEHTVQRTYLAITHGVPTPAAGRIESRLVELPDGSVRTSRRPGGGEMAVSEYKTLTRDQGLAAVRVTLYTGRKHQIRAHLTERGVPIAGDRVYGKPDDAPRLMLAAVRLGFNHPRTSKPMLFELAVPTGFPLLEGQKISPD